MVTKACNTKNKQTWDAAGDDGVHHGFAFQGRWSCWVKDAQFVALAQRTVIQRTEKESRERERVKTMQTWRTRPVIRENKNMADKFSTPDVRTIVCNRTRTAVLVL